MASHIVKTRFDILKLVVLGSMEEDEDEDDEEYIDEESFEDEVEENVSRPEKRRPPRRNPVEKTSKRVAVQSREASQAKELLHSLLFVLICISY